MSWWTNIRDVGEAVMTGGIAGAFNKNIGNAEGSLFNKITGRPNADERRTQQYALNDQVKAYKDQTALTQQQINETRAQQDVTKRQINEKQIRALRNNYRPAGGFLNNQGGAAPAPGSLGNNPGLPNKLGTA